MTPQEAPTSSPPPSSLASSSQIPGLDLLSAAQFDAQVAARRAAPSPNTPASKRPKLDTPGASSSTAPRTLLPSKPRGDSAAKVNDMCQIRQLRTDYDFEENPPYAFSATLRLLDGDQEIQSFEAPGTFGSKKAAKEKAAEMAVTWLEKHPVPKKGQKDAALLPLAATKVDPSENWVGVLHEFCQGRGIDQPEYSIYELGPQRFGATCTILSQTHHDQNAAFSSKKIAKTSAARAAVLALREEGVLIKHFAHARSMVAPAVPAFGTPLPPPTVPVVASTPKVQPTPSPPSASSLVPTLCAELNIAPPTYKLVQTSTLTPDFWDGEARFDHAVEPCLCGAVGRVERVYGKKNAKDKVVQQVLEVLEEVKQQRMAG
ncbi:unnamed protein product [Aureobasidium vineae]|uniref:DRBM domain-containing protein n=1 Tax=Aureobasidium vineae TaxID=2773715 RepID=A0A9N8JID9_9PEZI|nr:unnamed protein product [Aureobasidium vineae]